MAFKSIKPTSRNMQMTKMSILIIIVGLLIILVGWFFGLFKDKTEGFTTSDLPSSIYIKTRQNDSDIIKLYPILNDDVLKYNNGTIDNKFLKNSSISNPSISVGDRNKLMNMTGDLKVKLSPDDLPFRIFYFNSDTTNYNVYYNGKIMTGGKDRKKQITPAGATGEVNIIDFDASGNLSVERVSPLNHTAN